MNFTFNNSSIVSVNSGTIVLNVSGKTRTFVDAKLVSAINGNIVLDLPELSTIEVGTYLVVHIVCNGAKRIFIAKAIEKECISYYITQYQGGLKSTGEWSRDTCRYATPEEIQELNDQLEAEGKRWNPVTMQIEKLRWKPMEDTTYFNILITGGATQIIPYVWRNDTIDRNLYNLGNCFKTKEEAEAKLEQIKKLLLKV